MATRTTTAFLAGMVMAALTGQAAPELAAVRVAQAPVLDGRMADACWEGVPVATDFSVLGSGGSERAFRQTAVRAVWDSRALYVSALCHEPLPEMISTAVTARDGAVWMDDAVELFLQPAPAAGPVYHLVINAAGVLFDQRDSDRSFNLSTTPAAAIVGDSWGFELAIPWAELGVSGPHAGMLLGFNAGREHRPHDPEWSTWAALEKGVNKFMVPAHFGRLRLVDAAPPARVSALSVSDSLLQNGAFADLDAAGKPVHWRTANGTRRSEIVPGGAQYALRNEADYGIATQTLKLPAQRGQVFTITAVLRGGGGAEVGIAAVQSMSDGRFDELHPFWKVPLTGDFRVYRGRVFTDEGVETIDRVSVYRANRSGWLEVAYLEMVPGSGALLGIDDVSECTRPDERGVGVPAVTPGLGSFTPLAAGPLRALVFVGQYQRDVAELAQRLDMDYDLVYCPKYRGSGTVENAIAEDAQRVMTDLVARRYDLIVLAGRPSEPGIINGILASVRRGTGLVLIEPLVAGRPAHPETYQLLEAVLPDAAAGLLAEEILSPWNAASLRASSGDQDPVTSLSHSELEAGRIVRLTWRETVQGLIPFAVGSGEYWEYRWALLARSALWAADRLPAARIEQLGIANVRIANPQGLACRLETVWDTPDGLLQAEVIEVPAGPRVEVSLPVPAHLRYARGPVIRRLQLRDAGGNACDVGGALLPDTAPRLELADLRCPNTAEAGRPVSGSVVCRAAGGAVAFVEVALIDAYGRVVDQQEQESAAPEATLEFELDLRAPLAVYHRVVVTARDGADSGQRVVAARLSRPLFVPAAAKTHLDDFQLGAGYAVMQIMCQPYLLDSFVDYLRSHGVTACTVNKTLVERGMPAWGGTLSGGTMAHRDGSSTRATCYSQPEQVKTLCERSVAVAAERRKWGYLGYNMHDEVHLSQKEIAEVCDCADCLAGFQAWAAAAYGTLQRANDEWGTTYTDFAQVTMPTIAGIASSDNPALWVDYRMFMERVWAGAYREAYQAVKAAYPDVNLSFTNPYKYGPLSGTNFALWTPHEDVMLRYFHRHVAERCRSWSDAPMLAWIGYRSGTDSLRHFMWRFAMGGGAMPIWWDPILPWAYSGKRGFTPWNMFDPLWRETPRGQAVTAAALELQRGLGRVLRTAEPVSPEALVLHSQESLAVVYAEVATARGGRLTDAGTNQYRASDDAMAWALQRRSLAYAYTQGDRLDADLEGVRLIALPSCVALADSTVAALERFVAAGGRLLADRLPATHTEHGRPRSASPLAPLFDGVRGICLEQSADSGNRDRLEAGLAALVPLPAVAVRTPAGTSPVSARLFRFRFGEAELVGVIQGTSSDNEDALVLDVPADGRVWYDVRRGEYLGLVRGGRRLELAAGDAAFLALFPSRPGALQATVVQQARELRIEAAVGDVTPAARHVFRVDVIRPGETAPAHCYSRNVQADGGRALVQLPLAVNDPAGDWRIRITDVLTGGVVDCTVAVSL